MIRVEREGHLASVTIDNAAKRNAMSQAMWIAMGDAIEALSREADLRCVVLRGAGEQAFGSGADIDEFEAIRASKSAAVAFARHGHRAMHAGRDCPIPTPAGIRGFCIAGGLELSAFSDVRACTPDARCGIPIARRGAVMAYPELEGLVRVAGPNTALELLLEGRLMGAQEAYAKGLVNRVVAEDGFDAEVAAIATRICAGAPLSARFHKKAVERLRRNDALTEAELAEGYACYDTEDYVIGYRSFLAKQPPVFRGR